MIPDHRTYPNKNLSVAKALLAALWHTKQVGRDKLLSHRYVRLLCQNKHRNTYRSSISRLYKSKFVKKDYNNILILTEEGEKESLRAFIEVESALHRKGESSWDGGWRMVFFDIPEEKRKHRDYLRKILKLIGFYEFQRSIWVYPYPVPQFLKSFIFEKEIKPHVRFITTNSIDNDKDLRIIFGLMGGNK